MRVAITGTRDPVAALDFGDTLQKCLAALPKDSVVILGDAKGIDALAKQFCEKLGLEHIVCCANWERYGRAAGPKRNSRMLDLEPDEVWWFHPSLRSRSKGTRNCVDQARTRGIEVRGWGNE